MVVCDRLKQEEEETSIITQRNHLPTAHCPVSLHRPKLLADLLLQLLDKLPVPGFRRCAEASTLTNLVSTRALIHPARRPIRVIFFVVFCRTGAATRQLGLDHVQDVDVQFLLLESDFERFEHWRATQDEREDGQSVPVEAIAQSEVRDFQRAQARRVLQKPHRFTHRDCAVVVQHTATDDREVTEVLLRLSDLFEEGPQSASMLELELVKAIQDLSGF
jgi:hypothetical protein